MKTTRYKYEPREYGLSHQNEPGNDTFLSANVRKYPDMYYAYKKFKRIFELDDDNFFLGNGCENVIKNVLLALRPKTMLWHDPTWRMLYVYCEALKIKPIVKQFIYDGTKFVQEDWDENVDVWYSNDGISTQFTYEKREFDYSKCKYILVDLTYKSIPEMIKRVQEIKNSDLADKTIIVGSFDKEIGGGLRLGYAIYPKQFHEDMEIQREQYINMLAYIYLINYDSNVVNHFKDIQLDDCDYLTNNYITIKGNVPTELNALHFNVSGQDFTRFGIPGNLEERNALVTVIKDFIDERHYNKQS